MSRELEAKISRCARQPGLHRGGVDQTGLLEGEESVGEDGEVGNPAYVVLRGEGREFLGIDLDDDGASGEIVRSLGDVRSCHAARSAPGCPEIHQDGNLAVANHLLEFVLINLDRIGDWGKRSLARSTASGVGEMGRRNSVGLSARLTIADEWHDLLPL